MRVIYDLCIEQGYSLEDITKAMGMAMGLNVTASNYARLVPFEKQKRPG